MKTPPILLLIFNRPDTTQKVFDEIRKAKPVQLFVAADGPRKDRLEDLENCRKTREIIRQVDWDCNISTLFRDENLGCKLNVSWAINWFFSHVEEGIILEDDCLPDQSFFPFCGELLERYRNDKRMMMISGDNFLFGQGNISDSYYFSRQYHIWGWATWRRSWAHYDVGMQIYPEAKRLGLIDARCKQNFDKTYCGDIPTWDYQWVFACQMQSGFSIAPSLNLVTNIGMDSSRDTLQPASFLHGVPTGSIGIPLTHPEFIVWNKVADQREESIYRFQSAVEKIYSECKRWMR